MLLLNVALLAVASVTHLSDAYPFEVAKAACEDMTPKGPGHQNVKPQNSKDFDWLRDGQPDGEEKLSTRLEALASLKAARHFAKTSVAWKMASLKAVPYSFSLNTKSVSNGGSVEHTIIQKEGGPTFAAFMVQARSGTSVKPIGIFQPKTDNARTIKCTEDNDTGSHNSPDPKNSVTLIWTPPTDFKGQITFYCTVAETKVKFWVHQKCGTITVK